MYQNLVIKKRILETALKKLNQQTKWILMREGDIIKLGKDELNVIKTPGHVCFYCEKQNFVIGGDVLFQRSIGRTDLPGGNYDTLIKSIHTKLFVLPDETVVYSGHGEPTTIGEEKKYNPFLN